jgi:hypothetical protein
METRGTPITCQNCGYKFKFYSFEKKKEWIENDFACPICKEVWCNKPKTERKLFYFQKRYIEETNEKDKNEIFTRMIDIMLNYCKSLLLKFYSQYIYNTEDLNYYSHNAVSFVVEEFLSKQDYKANYSFAGILKDKIKQALFRKEEKQIPGESLNYEFDDGHESEYTFQDHKKTIIESIEEQENKIDLCKYMFSLVIGVEKYCTNYIDYKRILAIRHYLVSGENYADKIFRDNIYNEKGDITQEKIYGRGGKDKYLKTLGLMKQELQKLAC